MPSQYISRSIEPVLHKAASEFPAVTLTGPRQSGKTTLLKHLFGERYDYVSLDAPDVRAAAQGDPRGFLDMHRVPVILDEIQNAPDLLPYIKGHIDENRDQPGQFLLTGSQNILLAEKITESLAGRSAMLKLLPLSRHEIEARPDAPLPWEEAAPPHEPRLTGMSLWSAFLKGSYPELVAHPERDAHLWQSSYIQTYLERDVRSLRDVGDLSQFQLFLRALASRTAQLLNISDLARELGIAVNTAKAWISVLEATYQIVVLRPYHTNVGKRLVKTPKVYFTDTGILCHLTGLKDPEHAAAGPMAGPIMETAVLTEILKTITHRGENPQLYFWRTSAGNEVDIVIEAGGRLLPIEVKKTATPRASMAGAMLGFQKDLGEKALPGYLVHTGETKLPLGQGNTALPFSDL